jgi:hypothetical protein
MSDVSFESNVGEFKTKLIKTRNATSQLLRGLPSGWTLPTIITPGMFADWSHVLDTFPIRMTSSKITSNMSFKKFRGILSSFQSGVADLITDCEATLHGKSGIWRAQDKSGIDYHKCYTSHLEDFYQVFSSFPSKQVAQTGAVCVDCNRPIQRFV